MRIIGLYVNGQRHVLDDSAAILSRANQALATLERYKLRLDEVSGTLSALEIEDLVTVRDAVAVVQRLEMVRRIADEISGYVVELGTDGRLLALQLDELMAGVDSDRTLVIRDYLPTGRKARTLDEALVELDLLTATEMIDLVAVAKAIGYPGASDALDAAVSPARLPAAGQGAPAAGARSSTAWSTTSAACSACWAPRSRTCRPSRASATPGPGASARACPGWPRPRSSSATSEPPGGQLDDGQGDRVLTQRAQPGPQLELAGRRRGPARLALRCTRSTAGRSRSPCRSAGRRG